MHAHAQLIGGRSHQCDAAATFTQHGTRAFVVLDGIGSSDDIRQWTRSTARRLARLAVVNGAESALRHVHDTVAAHRRELGWRAEDEPCAVAVVAVAVPGKPLGVAWCGDSRAYLSPSGGPFVRLTRDHNMRQRLLDIGLEPDRYARNTVTSYLGNTDETYLLGTATVPASGRLLLLSDGAYEPLEDSGHGLGDALNSAPRTAARRLVAAAVEHSTSRTPDNATALVADLGSGTR
jgi:serine/threonine protein phosphatase PrpC